MKELIIVEFGIFAPLILGIFLPEFKVLFFQITMICFIVAWQLESYKNK